MSFKLHSYTNKDYIIASKHWLPIWDLLCDELKLDSLIRYNGNIGNLMVNEKLCNNIKNTLYNLVISGKFNKIKEQNNKLTDCFICMGTGCQFCKSSGLTPRRSLRSTIVYDIYTYCSNNIIFTVSRNNLKKSRHLKN